DLMCLDIMMPGVDGHQALERVRQIEKEHGILGSDGMKVIMTTALRDSSHCIRSFREGCESYYIKPIRTEGFLQQVHGLLGELTKIAPAEEPGGACPVVDRPPLAERHGRPAAASSGNARYLIVDDDRVCRELIKAMLEPYGNCTFAHDGQEAIDAVRLALEDGEPYDLVTLDIMMPNVSGHDALTGIRKVEADRGVCASDGVKVIMTTALRDSKQCVQSFREGCESFVTKPVVEEELLGKMRELGLLGATTSA
ncbi:MAG TPA: response regulator, partial [Thermoguttaceae bacterium]|nr:response regulator [Thermoguttaceae bacterium]